MKAKYKVGDIVFSKIKIVKFLKNIQIVKHFKIRHILVINMLFLVFLIIQMKNICIHYQ